MNRPLASDAPADVRASELNTHAFCAKAWHLQRVLDVPPSRDATRRRVAGTTRHERHGRAVRDTVRGRKALALAAVLLVLGVLLIAVALIAR